MLRQLIINRISELKEIHAQYLAPVNDDNSGDFPSISDIRSSCAAGMWDTITELQNLLDQDEEGSKHHSQTTHTTHHDPIREFLENTDPPGGHAGC